MKENDAISKNSGRNTNKDTSNRKEKVSKNSFTTNYGKTERIDEPIKIANTIAEFVENAKRIDICAQSIWPEELSLYNLNGTDKFKNTEKIRFVTEITEQNTQNCKEAMQYVGVRHLDGVRGNFAISDSEYIAASTLFEGRKIQQILYSNSPIVLEQQQYIFDTFWRNATPAEQRFKDMANEGHQTEHTIVIRDPKEFIKMVRTVTESTREEMVMIFSSANSFRKAIGFVDFDIYSRLIKEKGVNIKVLVIGSTKEETRKAIDTENNIRAQENTEYTSEVREILEYIKGKMQDIRFGFIEGRKEHIEVSMVIADGSESIIWEEDNNDDDNGLKEKGSSIGIRLAIYSNNKPIAWAYHVIFNSLWAQHHMYKDLEKANKKIVEHDKMRTEFINIAAHELRTPVQTITGYSELATTDPEYIEFDKNHGGFLGSINRTAVRLQKLTQLILDVARIENQKFHLQKEQSDLVEIIKQVIRDFQKYSNKDKMVNIYGPVKEAANGRDKDNNTKGLSIYLDRERIIQVLTNLLENAVKFTSANGKDTVTITVKTSNTSKGKVIVSVKDTGKGIHKDIQHRLFTKFATKSDSGTGLGLFIAKSIIEAHGGRIWAENNREGGATFSFSLPLIKGN